MGDIVDHARVWAEKRHYTQGCTYGAHEFTYHLDRVWETLQRFGHKERALGVVCMLHDVVEDTPTTIQEIREVFGGAIGDMVWALTDEEGENRRERQLKTYVKLREACKPYPQVLNVKLADRIANAEASAAGINSHHFSMYQSEHPFFCRELGQAGGDPKMWGALDKLMRLNPLEGPARQTVVEWDVLLDVAPTVQDRITRQAPKFAKCIEALREADERFKKK